MSWMVFSADDCCDVGYAPRGNASQVAVKGVQIAIVPCASPWRGSYDTRMLNPRVIAFRFQHSSRNEQISGTWYS